MYKKKFKRAAPSKWSTTKVLKKACSHMGHGDRERVKWTKDKLTGHAGLPLVPGLVFSACPVHFLSITLQWFR